LSFPRISKAFYISHFAKEKGERKMKKILALILIVVMAVGLVSCNGVFDGILGGILGERGDVSIVIENRDGMYDVYKAYLEDVEN
jgi:hypothetical protein